MMRIIYSFLLCLLWLTSPSVAASNDGRNLAVSATGAKRIALVIGNDHYQHVTALNNAVADARAMAAALQKAGFTVTLKSDADLDTMKSAVRQFKASLSGGDEAIFFYSGHGVQLGAANYLLPVSITSDNEDQVRDDAIPLQRLLDDLQDQKVKFALAIVDACRDNPFKGNGRSIGGTRGLAPTSAANGQMVIFSAGTGQQALDKLGNADTEQNGVFTRVFLQEMQKPGVEVHQVLRNVRSRVVQMAKSVNHDQMPALYDQVEGDFYFYGSGTQVASLEPVPVQNYVPSAPRAKSREEIEDETWSVAESANTVEAIKAYLAGNPHGRYVTQAKVKLAALKKQARESAPVTVPVTREDNEGALWNEVEKGNSADDYNAYLSQYPKGKYGALARSRIKKLEDEAAAEASQREQEAWDAAEQSGSEDGYQGYLKDYPSGRYAGLAQVRIRKLQTDLAAQTILREEDVQWKLALDKSTRASMQAYLEKYPNGRYVALAKQKDEEFQNIPVRPKLPFMVSEDIWRTLEASEAYRNLPRSREVKISYQAHGEREWTGAKVPSSLSNGAYSFAKNSEETPLGDKCSANRIALSIDGKRSSMVKYNCGSFQLGMVVDVNNESIPYSIIDSLEVQGSLFPMRIGAEQTVRTKSESGRMHFSQNCRVVSKGLAHDVDPKLTGVAWTLRCDTNEGTGNAQYTTGISEDYFLDDYGVFMHDIGQRDMSKNKYLLPLVGSQTLLVTEGDVGSRSTLTYKSYEWSVQ